MRKIVFFLLCIVISSQLFAQQMVTGRVTDENGAPVSNVSVIPRGGKNGTMTGADGTFTLKVDASAKTLLVSSVGMNAREIAINGNTTNYQITLTKNSANLVEVVVTSLGIIRDKRSLSYATQTLKADQFADKGEVNIINALQGKVAGVIITGASGGAGASTNINIRGISSFTGSNQPLFVIDGIPVSNDVDRTNGGPLGTLGDNQPANRAADIDMNNVESINILKGPAAAVLYGSRASAGAIIITTKKGGNGKGKAEVVANSSYSFQSAIGLPPVQNEFGQGLNGIYNPISTASWGPRFGSTPSIVNGLIPSAGGVATGPAADYRAYPNNIAEFFETGTISENSVSINGGDALRNQKFSIGNLNHIGILPNTSLKRTNVAFAANSTLGNKIKLGGGITFTNTLQNGILGGNGQSALGVLAGLSRSIDLTTSRVNGTYKNPNGSNNFVIPNTENPYFGAFENPLKSNLYRFTANTTVSYDPTTWLNISYRLGLDAYVDRRKQVFAVGSGRVPAGQVLENTIYRSEVNGDLIITATKNNLFVKGLNLTGLVGQNVNQRTFQSTQIQGDNLAIPGFYNISNATTLTNGSFENNSNRRLVGYYAQASFSYNNYLFLELTGRVDQSSTLPVEKNTYFYPSISTGFVFTDALKMNSKILSYGKIRASYAKVGRDAGPYQLSNLYVSGGYGNNVASFSFPFGTVAGFGASSTIAPITLAPEFTTSYEAGINLQFLRNRISLDVTYFDQVSRSQIINVGLAPSTGYASKTTNIGELSNKGIEVLLSGTVIKSKSLTWDVTGNFTKIKNNVVSIAPGIDNFAIPGSAFIGSVPSIKVNFPYGVIIGGTIPRSPDGERLINPATGGYQPTIAGQVLADPNPEYTLGFTNNFTYKSLSLGFTFDFTKGGQILSFTSALYKGRGVLDVTAIDRDQPRILPGVIKVGDKFVPNNIQVPAQTYWQTLGGLQSEFNVYDATVFRLRELSLGYNMPASLYKSLGLNGMRFSIFGRNLFYNAPNSIIDPAVNTQGAGNIRGLELQSAPNARTIGANLKITL